MFVKQWFLHLPATWTVVIKGIWFEIREIQCVEITDELLRSTGHMKKFCVREFGSFNPISSFNLLKLYLPGIKGSIPTAPL